MGLRLIALDFGTTTSKAIEVSAELFRNAVTGRTEIRSLKTLWRAEPELTPFEAEELNEGRLIAMVERWLSEGRANHAAAGTDDTIVGGVIITGIAAKSRNAQTIAQVVRRRLGEAVFAVADSPLQESWLAFMGSCAGLSGSHPETCFLNFDIGGGTTNIALGKNRAVLSAGSLWIGARHLRFQTGTYRLEWISPWARSLFRALGCASAVGDEMAARERELFLRTYIQRLENIVNPRMHPRLGFDFLEQAAMLVLKRGEQSVATFSGGVGEIVYRLLEGERFSVTPYGDLGVDLAEAIVASPVLAAGLKIFVPENRGRATVCGLAFHGVEASGTTLFVSRKSLLRPFRDLPLLGKLTPESKSSEVDALLEHAASFQAGSCLYLQLGGESLANLTASAGALARSLKRVHFPKNVPLILFMRENLGKSFGSYATEWGKIPVELMVIDEIDNRTVGDEAYLASIQPGGGQNIMVSFYGGMNRGSTA